MRHSIVFISVFFVLNSSLFAQTNITGVVTDSLNNPVAGASVYLSKTTVGTITGNNGTFSLIVPISGAYEMITSCIGYKPVSQFITTDGQKQTFKVKLLVNLILLNEVTVTSKDKNRLKNYSRFIKLFLGETLNAQNCKITNPEDIHFHNDGENNTLTAISIKPLHIENRALGYTIFYDLSDFSYNEETGILRFSGNHYFQPLKVNSKTSKMITRNRLLAYYGSRMNLFRAIFSGSAFNENFKLFYYKGDNVTNEILLNEPVPEKDLILSGNYDYKTINLKNPLLVVYTDNHPELSGSLTGFQPQKYLSTVTFSDTIRVFRNGYFDNPYALTWGGEMGNERVADLLPFDFGPESIELNSVDPYIAKSSIEEYLEIHQKTESPDQVFLHLDRNMYKPGDTIYFQAYIRDRFTNSRESKSVSLYTILYNGNQLKTDSSRFRIINSEAAGWMTIPQTAEPGKYHLVAFTASMQNYNPGDAFQIDLFIRPLNNDPEKIGITFDKENYQPGDTIHALVRITDSNNKPANRQKIQANLMTFNGSIDRKQNRTNSEGESLISFQVPDTLTYRPRLQILLPENANDKSTVKEVNVPFNDQYFELRFLPEGGYSIEGIEQRIAFNATNFKGEPVHIEGLLKTSKGTILDTIRSGEYGPGYFVCIPQAGMYTELINSSFKEKIWPLPDPLKTGISLSVKQLDNKSFAAEIQADSYNGDSLKVIGTMNSVLVFSQDIKMDKKQRLRIETDMLPAGVVQITVFNKELKPLSERLLYINADKNLRITIKTEDNVISPGKETELEISVTDGQNNPVQGNFSISVSDSVSGHDAELFTPGIDFAFNYFPYFLSNLPSKVLTKGLENLTDEERDALLMVFGWSRYNWNIKKEKKPVIELLNYDQLNMKILYALKINRADRRLDLISLEGPSVSHLITDSEGKISLPLDSLPEITRSLTMMPNTEHKKRVMGAMMSIPYNEKYFRSNKLFTPQPVIQYEDPKISPLYFNSSFGSDVIEIPEVTIKGHSEKRFYHDKYEEMYNYAEVKSLDYNLLWSSFSVSDAVYRMITPYVMTNNYIILRPPRSFITAPVPALIVLDGMAIPYRGWEQVRSMAASELTSLTILVGKQGYARYGEMAQGGIIFINTRSENPALMKLKTEWILQNKKDQMLVPISIYRPTKEFYCPTKHEIDSDPALQSRSTAFWGSEIYYDGKDPVKIKYTNLKRRGPVIITVNGVSTENLVGTGRASYNVF